MTDGSLYPVRLAEISSPVMYHHSFGTHLWHSNYVYTKVYKSTEKSKIMDINSPRNEPLIVLEYWSKNIEEYFHLCNLKNINLSDKSTTKDVKILLNSMVNHVNYMEQVIVVIQENFIES